MSGNQLPTRSDTKPAAEADQAKPQPQPQGDGPAEYPKMIYPKGEDGEPDYSRGVTVSDAKEEAQQQKAFDGQASKAGKPAKA